PPLTVRAFAAAPRARLLVPRARVPLVSVTPPPNVFAPVRLKMPFPVWLMVSPPDPLITLATVRVPFPNPVTVVFAPSTTPPAAAPPEMVLFPGPELLRNGFVPLRV